MEFLPKNRILEFREDQLNSVRKQFDLDKPGDMSRAVDVLEAWLKMQMHFMKKELPRNYLEKVILASKGSMERAKSRLDKMFTFRTIMPDFFGDNLTKNKFDDIDIFKNTLLTKLTDKDYRIYFLKNTGKTFTSLQLLNAYRYVILVCEYIMANDYNNGITIVVDYNETNIFGMIKALNLTDIRQYCAIITDGFGLRLKEIHLLTQSKAIDTFLSIIIPMISPKLAKRVTVHNDISTLYKYVPQDMLPAEYGGKDKPLLKLRDELMEELTSKVFLNYIEEMNDAKTDESCRQTDEFNDQYLGIQGSFRTLNVD